MTGFFDSLAQAGSRVMDSLAASGGVRRGESVAEAVFRGKRLNDLSGAIGAQGLTPEERIQAVVKAGGTLDQAITLEQQLRLREQQQGSGELLDLIGSALGGGITTSPIVGPTGPGAPNLSNNADLALRLGLQSAAAPKGSAQGRVGEFLSEQMLERSRVEQEPIREFNKQKAKKSAELLVNIQENAGSADQLLSAADQISQGLKEGAITGPFANERVFLTNLASTFGARLPEDVVSGSANAESIIKASNSVVLNLSERLKGALSDRDLAFLKNSTANITASPESIKSAVDAIRAAGEFALEVEQLASQAAESGGGQNLFSTIAKLRKENGVQARYKALRKARKEAERNPFDQFSSPGKQEAKQPVKRIKPVFDPLTQRFIVR